MAMIIKICTVLMLCFAITLLAEADAEVTTDAEVMLNASSIVPTVSDLQTLGRQAKSKKMPIILVYSASDCEHCERLEQDILAPLQKTGELKEVAILRKIMIDGIDSVTDFKGRIQDAEYYSIMRDVEFTPTIEFVDGDGVSLVAPIVGYQGVDMYLSYFKAAAQASQMITAAQAN